jgi:hypothetical protein
MNNSLIKKQNKRGECVYLRVRFSNSYRRRGRGRGGGGGSGGG